MASESANAGEPRISMILVNWLRGMFFLSCGGWLEWAVTVSGVLLGLRLWLLVGACRETHGVFFLCHCLQIAVYL